jgi:DNA-binding transcriptional LysR family regulator
LIDFINELALTQNGSEEGIQMELRQLRHFAELANTLNFRRAAQACRIAQPALSISLRKLETEIGVKLFDRGTREVSLTEAGRVALPSALAALDAARETAHLARSVMKGESGRLTIGIVASATYRLLPRVLPQFKKSFPNVDLQFVESTTQKIIEDVMSRSVDLGIVRSHWRLPVLAMHCRWKRMSLS